MVLAAFFLINIMTDKIKKYEAELLKVIKENKIAFFDHCFAFTKGVKRTTCYSLKLNESDVIKDAIDENRVTAKNYMLNKWIESDNPTLQVAAMRLLSCSEEHRLLNQTYVENKNENTHAISDDTAEILKKLNDKIK